MGKSILTPKQLNFLECTQQERSITDNFYLPGGTALAEFYLLHRFSEDIGLFSEREEVDFNYYPFPQIEKGVLYKKLKIDSLHDIAANKIHTLFMKPI